MKKKNKLLVKQVLCISSIGLLLLIGYIMACNMTSRYVDVVILKKQSIISAVYGIGTVTAQQTYQVKVGITSRITSIYVTEGDFVKKGRALLEYDNGIVVTSPFNGKVTSISQKAGELAYPQTTILQITDLRNRYVLVGLEQQSAAKVQPGMIAHLSFEGRRENQLTGVVKSVYPSEGQFFVRIHVEKLPETILPGMTLDTGIQIFEKKDAFVIPVKALLRSSILIRRERKVIEIPIKVGITDGSRVEAISPDLKEGDVVLERR